MGVALAAGVATPRVAAAATACTHDPRLDRVARWVVVERLATGRAPGDAALSARARAEGVPHPWPVSVVARAPAGRRAEVERALARAAASPPSPGAEGARCGAAEAHDEDGAVVGALVRVDVLAELVALPKAARTGALVELVARVPGARGARVVVRGRDGAPRGVLSSLHGDELRARFALSTPGRHDVQVVADLDPPEGTRPVLEASVVADGGGGASGGEAASPAPPRGPRLASPGVVEDAVARLRRGARRLPALRALVRSAQLDAVAQAHAEAAARAQRTAHDLGAGDPVARVARAGIEASFVAENVGHGRTLAAALEALETSPSHLANAVDARAARLGVGVVEGASGVWVVELFADAAPGAR